MRTATEINNGMDIIDSRDVIARIEELEDEKEMFDGDNWEETEEGEELAALLSLQEEAEGYSDDWKYGSTLIRESYFTEYAQELAEDIGAVDRNASWPNNCIDWEYAAKELQQDYTMVSFDGVDYWVR